jgi:hypothetical protein
VAFRIADVERHCSPALVHGGGLSAELGKGAMSLVEVGNLPTEGDLYAARGGDAGAVCVGNAEVAAVAESELDKPVVLEGHTHARCLELQAGWEEALAGILTERIGNGAKDIESRLMASVLTGLALLFEREAGVGVPAGRFMRAGEEMDLGDAGGDR